MVETLETTSLWFFFTVIFIAATISFGEQIKLLIKKGKLETFGIEQKR